MYPFLFHAQGEIDLRALQKDIKINKTPMRVGHDWYAYEFQSDYLLNYVKENFFGLKVKNNIFAFSKAKNCYFHIDGAHENHLVHRVLIPLDTHFQYNWYVDGKLHTHQPRAKEVLIFNNMYPHRFWLNDPADQRPRLVIAFDLVAEEAEPYIPFFTGVNLTDGSLDQKIRCRGS